MGNAKPEWLLLGMILTAVLLAGLVLGVVYWLKKKVRSDPGAWLRLADRFGVAQSPSGKILNEQTVKIGSVVYRNCATVGITANGLYLTTWRKGVLIPWTEFRVVTHGRLFWERVPVFSIGQPTVATLAVPQSTLDQFRALLPPEVQRTL